MRRRVETVVGILLICILLELAIATSTQAAQINLENNKNYSLTVDKNDGGDYTSIQEAVNNAQDGFTIYVKSGSSATILANTGEKSTESIS